MAETTFSNQDQLPNLPVPDLNETLTKYVESIEPFVSKNELEKTKELANKFVNEEGKSLHQFLLQRAESTPNWIEEWWENYAYLSSREPIAIQSNMFTGMGSFGEFKINNIPQARRAAEIIRYSLEYHELLINREEIPIDIMSKKKLCMNMYKRIFSQTREPTFPEMDTLQFYDSKEVNHVAVICGDCIFLLDVYDSTVESSKRILTIGDLEVQLKRILQHAHYFNSTAPKNERVVVNCGIGSLTSTKRDIWHTKRKELIQLNKINEENLRQIDRSLFVICLEGNDVQPTNPSEHVYFTSTGKCKNRWFDKGLQYIVYSNGMVGANMEHCNADATVFMMMFRWLGGRYLNRIGGTDTYIESHTSTYLPPPQPLYWHINQDIATGIRDAEIYFNKRAAKLDTSVSRLKNYGKLYLRPRRISADSLVQLGVQLTYFRLFARIVPTYESGHTRFFKNGRTETIRVTCNEVVEWVKVMDSRSISIKEKREKMDIAIQKHISLIMDALSGSGIDRHLFGLQVAAMGLNNKLPELFTDPAYVKSGGNGNFVLSTSNVSGYEFLWGGFTPMMEEGFGICYDIEPNFLGFLITCNKTATHGISAQKFSDSLFQSIRDICELFEKTSKSSL